MLPDAGAALEVFSGAATEGGGEGAHEGGALGVRDGVGGTHSGRCPRSGRTPSELDRKLEVGRVESLCAPSHLSPDVSVKSKILCSNRHLPTSHLALSTLSLFPTIEQSCVSLSKSSLSIRTRLYASESSFLVRRSLYFSLSRGRKTEWGLVSVADVLGQNLRGGRAAGEGGGAGERYFLGR